MYHPTTRVLTVLELLQAHPILSSAELAARLGSMFEQFELYDDAVECYRRAIELEPRRAESYISLAQLWFLRGDRDKAVASLEEMTRANSNDASMFARLSEALQKLSLPEKALEAITRACTLQPDQYLLPDRDVEVDLDRLVRRTDRDASR